MALVDPDTQDVQIVAPFGETDNSSAATGSGITSVDACRGLIYATERGFQLQALSAWGQLHTLAIRARFRRAYP